MFRKPAVSSAAILLIAAGLVSVAEPQPAAAASCSVLFDDFQYGSSTDPALAARHWTVRSGGGGPGIPGASWLPSQVTFPVADGQKVLQLSSYTDGTGAGTAQTEIYHQRKFFEGTYASRVRFTDAPVSGNDGDKIVETFFTITPLAYSMDPSYGEIDFEYLANGGWGETGPAFFETTWETYQPDPWIADNVHSVQRRSYNGWHDLVAQVSGGRVKYFIDGALVADHGDKFYPETPMSINYNLWFIDSSGHTGGRSTYIQQVDWLYFAGNEVISTDVARNRVNAYRSLGTTHVDTVGTGGTCPDPGGSGGPISSTTWYSIVNKTSGKCVDARASGTANGTAIQQYTCNNSNAQQYLFQPTGGSNVRINNRNNAAQVLDVSGVSAADNAVVHLWNYVGGGNQQWIPVAEGGGYYHFVSVHSGKCLDVPAASTADSVQLVQYTCNGTGAQSFRLVAQP
ncbi:RICIN domain-containing protein [Catellatospora sp. NPDC049609]|uniref:RICIN domain-containing protein n=1 Tax=Catellatospora sp. NPDC049609 TaxID=3155505 RepID=UPI00342D5357